MEALFQKSLYTECERLKALVVREVEKFDRALFGNPALAGIVQKIADKHQIKVAEFRGQVTAKRRVEERTIDDFGDRRVIDVKVLDVSIPFVGDPESFRIAPSRSGIPQRKAQIGSKALMITIPDDENADTTIDNFKKTIEGNLQTARTEFAQMKTQLDQAVSAAAERRRQEIAAEHARDKGRSFRVIKAPTTMDTDKTSRTRESNRRALR
jgi:hypothetical protein